MYRVLIVDDEAAHRKGMMQLLNRMKPEYLLLEARDGNLAELILGTVDIDIILTDIRMPNKDGLEFLTDLYEAGNRAKVIIVSGYGHFSYAKEAMSKGAFDFLLKPIDPEELEQVLERAEMSLETEVRRRQSRSRYLDLLLLKMVKSSLDKREEEELEGILPKHSEGVLFAIGTKRNKEGEEEESFFIDLRQKMKRALDVLGHTIMFEAFDGSVVYAGMVFLNQRHEERSDETILGELQSHIRRVLPKGMDVGISTIMPDLYACVMGAYHQAHAALQQTFYLNGESCVYSLSQKGTRVVLDLLAEKEDELVNLIRYHDHGAVQAVLTSIFEQLATMDQKPNPNRLKENFVLLGMRVINLLQKKGVVSEYHEAISGFTNRIMESERIEELEQEVENLCLMLNDIAGQGGSEDVIQLSIRYLEEHYAEEIALTQVAEKFFFTPSYYSIYFKKKTGKPFSQYLKDVRMDHALRMLRETNKKVGEISAEAGYSDSAYFGKVFKKNIGCSPEEYRKKNYRI